MQNSNESAKSRGIVAFAYNTSEIDYVSIAHKTLAIASRVLDLPYTLVTDGAPGNWTNERYSIDLGRFVEWRNVGRHAAYEASPYDETLVIDVDYLVQDRELLKIFDTAFDYRIVKHSHALSGEHMPHTMGPTSLPFVWATVFAFRKTSRTQAYFELIKRIQDNYGYYRALYNIEQRNYRNDYAFAIADTILNGYQLSTNTIPGSMLTVDQRINSITLDNNKFIIRDSTRAYVVPRTNLHIMSKQYLQSDNFDQLIQQLHESV